MARTVPDGISGALVSVVRQPNLSLVVRDPFDRPYSSATGGAAGRSSITRQADGSYVRAYVTQPGVGVDASVYSQRLTDLSDPTQLSAWSLRSTDAAMQAGVCVAIFGSTLFLFYQRRSDNAVCYQTSPDGVTWTAEAVASSPGVTVWAMASTGANDLIQSQDASPGEDSTQTVVLLAYGGGSFTTTSAWTNPTGRVTGLSAVLEGGAYRIALGAQSRNGGSLALCTLGYSGSAWSGLTAIHPIDDPATGLTIPYPTITLIDGAYRIGAETYDSGVATGAADQRCEMWVSTDFVHWYMEQEVDGAFVDGACVLSGPEGGWLLADAGTILLSTTAAGATSPDIDLSDQVFTVDINEPANDVTTAVVVVDNHDGGNSPAFPASSALRVGGQAQIGLGYGPDLVTTHTLWIDRLDGANATLETDGRTQETATVTLHLSSRARRLDRKAPVERVYLGANLLYLASAVAVAGGVPSAPMSPGAAQFSEVIDAFALGAGDSGHVNTLRTAFDRLRSLFGFDWFVDENEALQLREPQPDDSVAYAYGNGMAQTIGHEISPVRQPNQVRVAAPAAGTGPQFADAIDFAAQSASGEVVLKLVADRLLQSSAQAQIRAGLELRRAQRDSVQGWARLPLNPAHQPLDLISIADESLIATLRIERIHWLVDMSRGGFEQQVELRAP